MPARDLVVTGAPYRPQSPTMTVSPSLRAAPSRPTPVPSGRCLRLRGHLAHGPDDAGEIAGPGLRVGRQLPGPPLHEESEVERLEEVDDRLEVGVRSRALGDGLLDQRLADRRPPARPRLGDRRRDLRLPTSRDERLELGGLDVVERTLAAARVHHDLTDGLALEAQPHRALVDPAQDRFHE